MLTELLLLALLALLVVTLLLLYIILFVTYRIKMMEELFFPTADARREKVKDNLAILNTGKKQWSPEMIDKATEKQLASLLKRIKAKEPKEPPAEKDLISKVTGVVNFADMVRDANSNFLIQSYFTQVVGNVVESMPTFTSDSPVEILGSHVYERLGPILRYVAIFSTVFNHLDWERYAEIAGKRYIINGETRASNQGEEQR